MKEFFVSIAFIAFIVAAVGGEPTTVYSSGNKDITNIVETLNQHEIELLNHYVDNAPTKYYSGTYHAIAKSRKHFGKPVVARSDDLVPFCDVIEAVRQDETQLTDSKRYSITQQWYDTYGISLYEQCKRENEVQNVSEIVVNVKDVDPVEQVQNEATMHEKEVQDIKDATVVVDNQLLLKPEQIRELRTSIVDCRRAQNKLIDILGAYEDLTVEHYNDVTKLVVQCERAKLENELNFN